MQSLKFKKRFTGKRAGKSTEILLFKMKAPFRRILRSSFISMCCDALLRRLESLLSGLDLELIRSLLNTLIHRLTAVRRQSRTRILRIRRTLRLTPTRHHLPHRVSTFKAMSLLTDVQEFMGHVRPYQTEQIYSRYQKFIPNLLRSEAVQGSGKISLS